MTRNNTNSVPLHPLRVDRFQRNMRGAPVDYGVAPIGTIRFFTIPPGTQGPWYITEILSHDRTLSELLTLIAAWKTGILPEKYDTPLESGNPFTSCRAAAVFLTELLAKELRLRWIAQKFIARLRERVYARRIVGADADLCTTEPVPPHAAIYVRDIVSRSMYVFHVKTITNMIRNALNYSNYGIACPQPPKNPYTNKPWSYNQLMTICSQIIAYAHVSLRINHPADIYEFRLCEYDAAKYFLKHADRLNLQGAQSFFSEIHNNDLYNIRKEIIDDLYEIIGHDICSGWRTVSAFTVERLLPTNLNARWDKLLCSYWIYMNLNKVINFESHDTMLEEFTNLHSESYNWWCAQPRRLLRRPPSDSIDTCDSV